MIFQRREKLGSRIKVDTFEKKLTEYAERNVKSC